MGRPPQAVRLHAVVQLGVSGGGPERLLRTLEKWAAGLGQRCERVDLGLAFLRGLELAGEAALAAHKALWAWPGSCTQSVAVTLQGTLGSHLSR